MSTISEVDIRDWDKVDFEIVRENIEEGRYYQLHDFLAQIELIRNKQIQSVAALLRRPE